MSIGAVKLTLGMQTWGLRKYFRLETGTDRETVKVPWGQRLHLPWAAAAWDLNLMSDAGVEPGGSSSLEPVNWC